MKCFQFSGIQSFVPTAMYLVYLLKCVSFLAWCDNSNTQTALLHIIHAVAVLRALLVVAADEQRYRYSVDAVDIASLSTCNYNQNLSFSPVVRKIMRTYQWCFYVTCDGLRVVLSYP